MTLVLFSSRALAGVAQSLIFVLLARQVPSSLLGWVSSFIAIGTFGVSVCDLGVGTLLLRVHARSAKSEKQAAILQISAYGMLVLSAALAVIFGIAYTGKFSWPSAILLIFWLATERNSETWLAMAIAESRHAVVAGVVLVRRLLPLGAFVILLARRFDAVFAFAIAQAIGGLIGVIIARVSLSDSFVRTPRFRSAASVIRESRPFWIAVASSQSRELETSIVSGFLGGADAGLYALGMRLIRPFQLLAVSLAQASLVAHTRDGGRRARRAASRIGLFAVAAALIALVIAQFVPWTLERVVGSQYVHASFVVQVFLVSASFISLGSPLASILQALGDERMVAQLAVSAAASATSWCFIAGASHNLGLLAFGVSAIYVVKFWALEIRLLILSHRGHVKGDVRV